MTVSNNIQDKLSSLSKSEYLDFMRQFLNDLLLKNLRIDWVDEDRLMGQGSIELGILTYWYSLLLIRDSKTIDQDELQMFRKSMQPHIDKGMIFTMGNFNREAKKSAKQKGMLPIDLIDAENWMMRIEKFERLSEQETEK